MTYAVSIRPAAQRQFARLPADAKKTVAAALEGLASAPRPHNHISSLAPRTATVSGSATIA